MRIAAAQALASKIRVAWHMPPFGFRERSGFESAIFATAMSRMAYLEYIICMYVCICRYIYIVIWYVYQWLGGPSLQYVTVVNWFLLWNMNFIFPYIGNNHTNSLLCFRGVETTNQLCTRIWLLNVIDGSPLMRLIIAKTNIGSKVAQMLVNQLRK